MKNLSKVMFVKEIPGLFTWQSGQEEKIYDEYGEDSHVIVTTTDGDNVVFKVNTLLKSGYAINPDVEEE